MGSKSKIVLAAMACTLLSAAAVRVGAQQSAASEPKMVGTWKLVSFLSIVEGEPPRDAFGANPRGYLILTRDGRLMTVITSSRRKAGTDDAERAALQKSMLSYSGRYRIDGDLIVTSVDVSWNEAWNGTEQKRHFRFEGDRLLIDTVRQPSVVSPGKMAIGRLVWEQEK